MEQVVNKLMVNLKERSYPIYIGEQLLTSHLLENHIKGQQVLIVTNTTIAPDYLAKVQQPLTQFQCDSIILQDGEQFKTLDSINVIIDSLIKQQHRRSTTL